MRTLPERHSKDPASRGPKNRQRFLSVGPGMKPWMGWNAGPHTAVWTMCSGWYDIRPLYGESAAQFAGLSRQVSAGSAPLRASAVAPCHGRRRARTVDDGQEEEERT